MITLEEVLGRVEWIRQNADDDETAHIAEDSLHLEVLEAIAAGASNSADLAREALRTADIRFARWCA